MVMRRVLITGAAGFIGRHCLAPLLDRGFEVHALAQAFAEQRERRFVGAGTCAEYDWSQARLSEQATRLARRNLYGASKLDFFRILDAYARQSGLVRARYLWRNQADRYMALYERPLTISGR
jgi:nucleoside-diphosphate-sugar epimerase